MRDGHAIGAGIEDLFDARLGRVGPVFVDRRDADDEGLPAHGLRASEALGDGFHRRGIGTRPRG